MPKRRQRRAPAHTSSERALATQKPQQGPTVSMAARQPHLSEGVMFPPGEPLRPVAGVTTPDGAPRQWAYPVGYNIAQRPRATEQTSFDQLRNLAALYDGIRLCTHALQIVTAPARSQAAPPASASFCAIPENPLAYPDHGRVPVKT